MTKRWSDFLFAMGVRFVCGFVIGCLVGLLLGWRLILERAARDGMRFVVFWLSTWALAGAIVTTFRTSHLLEPGFKGPRGSGQQRTNNTAEENTAGDFPAYKPLMPSAPKSM